MKNTLKRLTQLQEVDAKAYALRIRRDEIPKQIEEQVRAVRRADSRQKTAEDRARELQKSVDLKNLDLKECEEKIYQKEVQLNTISTNEAYKAMLREIAGLKADKSQVEDAILEHSYAQDEIAEEIAAAKKESVATRDEYELRKAELSDQAGALDAEIEQLMEQRKVMAEELDHDALNTYDRVLKRRAGRAMAAVRDQHCQGCQMNLTLQEMTLLLSCKELLTCRTCSRILYLEEVVEA